jgi:hypothetical protein
MDRRTFNKLISTATIGMTPNLKGIAQAHPGAMPGDDGVKFATKWPEQVYRRLLIDTHIPDWDPLFLSRFDTAEYVDIMSPARASNN